MAYILNMCQGYGDKRHLQPWKLGQTLFSTQVKIQNLQISYHKKYYRRVLFCFVFL